MLAMSSWHTTSGKIEIAVVFRLVQLLVPQQCMVLEAPSPYQDNALGSHSHLHLH